jgi:YD repeat-containing protein
VRYAFLVLGFGATMLSAGTTYDYDAQHRLTRATYDNHTSMSYEYDASGNRTKRVVFVPALKLILDVAHDNWGQVAVEPNLPTYPYDTPVTLTATPIPGKSFGYWEILDPNDPNRIAQDSNNVLHLRMTTDWHVTAVFKCGSGIEEVVPLLAIGLAVFGFAVRRMRRS